MGWFDDSDSEESGKETRREPIMFHLPPNDEGSSQIAAGTISSEKINSQDEVNDDGEDDPLDIYMMSLPSATAKTTTIAAKHGRLDVDNEEEEIEEERMQTNYDEKMSSDFAEDSKRQPKDPKSSLETRFHRAGDSRKSSMAHAEDGVNDFDEAQKITIEPLEKVDHSRITYQSFRKHFRNPSNTPSGSAWRKDHDVTCSDDQIDPVLAFTEYQDTFAPEVLSYLESNNYRIPTPVQAQSIPVSLTGQDLIVTSRTGSGKTLAYLLPLFVHVMDQDEIKPNVDGPIAIVLTPTRELAKQVYVIAKQLFKCLGAKVIVATGGLGTYEMSKELKRGCELVVSTPGRLIDMVKRKATNLERVTIVVLDEADKMLEMGFGPQVSSILESIRSDRQTLMFSATFGKKVENNARKWLHRPVRIAIGRTGTSSEHVQQHVMYFKQYEDKVTWLLEMIPILAPVGRMIIFVASRDACNSLTSRVNEKIDPNGDIRVDFIHGERHQIDRNKALSSFRDGRVKVLIATDVASRGLDVTDVMTVINFDPAKSYDSHVHRCGRAGRLSKTLNEQKQGVAYTLLTDQDADFGLTLLESFEREGRGEITKELIDLSMKSKRYGGSRPKHSRQGLGFQESENKRSRWGS